MNDESKKTRGQDDLQKAQSHSKGSADGEVQAAGCAWQAQGVEGE